MELRQICLGLTDFSREHIHTTSTTSGAFTLRMYALKNCLRIASFGYIHDRWLPFDKIRNYPDLGPRFMAGEKRAKEILLRKAQAQLAANKDVVDAHNVAHTHLHEHPEEDAADLAWATVLKRTFEAYVRGERPNMYGEWIRW